MRKLVSLFLASAILFLGNVSAADAKRDDSAAEKLGWRLSMASYTVRKWPFMDAVDAIAGLGLKYMDVHPSVEFSKDNKTKTDHNISPELIEEMKKKLQAAGVKVVSYGTVNLGATEESVRKVFAYAKALGAENIVCEPKPEQIPMLDKLTQEYGVNIALHNHPKPSTYAEPEAVLKAVEGASKKIGSCSDTGHWQRTGLGDPTECLKKLKGRIISLHFKDVVPAGKVWNDVPWGTGQSNVKSMLTELKDQGFRGVLSIEYEHGTGQALLDDCAKCIACFDKIAAELAK